MWQSKHIYAWRAKWVIGSREKERNMAALIPQFKIKRALGWEESARLVCANFSKWTYRPSIKTSRVRDCTKRRYFSLVEISSSSMILSKGRSLWKRLLKSISFILTSSYFIENDRRKVWPQTHTRVRQSCIWTISDQVGEEGWIGLQDVPNETENMVPLRLTGGAFAEKEDFSQIKFTLYTAFATDGFLAYEQFTEQHLCLGGVTETLSSIWVTLAWHVHSCKGYQIRLNVSFALRPKWTNYSSTSCWLAWEQLWKTK